MRRLFTVGAMWFLVSAVSVAAQTVRVSGSVRTGRPSRKLTGRGLTLIVSTEKIRIGRIGKSGDSDNFARCVTTPVRGPNDLDFLAADFDPARGKARPAVRRCFDFVLTAAHDEAECTELARATDPDAAENNWHSHPIGHAVVTLSHVRVNRPTADLSVEIRGFEYTAILTLPPKSQAEIDGPKD